MRDQRFMGRVAQGRALAGRRFQRRLHPARDFLFVGAFHGETDLGAMLKKPAGYLPLQAANAQYLVFQPAPVEHAPRGVAQAQHLVRRFSGPASARLASSAEGA